MAVAAASVVVEEDFPADPAAVAAVVSAAEGPLAAASAEVGAAPVPLEEAEAAAAVLSAEAAALAVPVADSPVDPAAAAVEVSPVDPAVADADKTKKEITARKSRDFLFGLNQTDRDSANSRPGLCLVRKPADHSPSKATSRRSLKSSRMAAPVHRTSSSGLQGQLEIRRRWS